MEVVGTEEKKKIFRARKTMKISDRQQLDTLHSTLLTADPGLSNPSPPPLVNGTHKEDGQKTGEKEQNTSDSNSPHAMSPVSPTPYLSLNLSPSPSSSQSPKAKEDIPTPPTSPFHSLNFELKKMNDGEEEKGSSSLLPSDPVTLAPTESKDNKEKDTEKIPEDDKQEGKHATTQDPALDSTKDSLKGLLPCPPVPSPVSDCSKPMDTDSDTTKAEDPEASAAKMNDEKPSTPKPVTSNCSPSCSSSSPLPASSSSVDLKQTEIRKQDIKDEEDKKEDVKKESVCEVKMEVDSLETKEKKTILGKTAKPSRPSSTPPSNIVQEEKSSNSGLKRTLSEGTDATTVKREGKRPKMDREELEAQLELKITANAGSHHKLQKIVQQLVDERIRVMELTIFNKHFQELKDRVEKIDCVNKHQHAITTLQAKITRLSKKFGEANQASENKKKKEALAAAAAAASAAATAAASNTASAASTSAPKPLTGANTPQIQRVIHRQTVEAQPEVPSERVAPSVGKAAALPVHEEKNKEKMEEEVNTDMSPISAMAKRLAEFSEGDCKADIDLRTISPEMEKEIYKNCKRSTGIPRPDRYASYVFRSLVPYDVYCDWVAKVNYTGMLGKEALPRNLRKTIKIFVERRFPRITCNNWRDVREAVNQLLRMKRKPEFFRDFGFRRKERPVFTNGSQHNHHLRHR